MTSTNETKQALEFTSDEMIVLRQKYTKLTDAEFGAFLAAAQRYLLNPLANQIHARLTEETTRNPRAIVYMTQIDGYRLIADRTGSYAGNDDPIYTGNDQGIQKATVTVSKIVAGLVCKFTASARWSEYCPGGNAGFMWEKMPFLMLGKCAEALALRKAFPAELSGLYVAEELDQAQDPATDGKPAGRATAKPQPATDATPPAGKTEAAKDPATAPAAASKPAAKPGLTLPKDWPKTKTGDLVKWVAGFRNLAELKVAVGYLEAQTDLPQYLDDWLDVMTGVAAKYKQVTEGFSKGRDPAFEQVIKGILETIEAGQKARANV